MHYPKKLTVQIPVIDFPTAILLNNVVRTPDSDKDFGLGELYVPSATRANKLSPRKDISPSIFNVSRVERRKHPSNFEKMELLKKNTLAVSREVERKKKEHTVSIFNTTGIRSDTKDLYRQSHPTKFKRNISWDFNGRRIRN